jgi:hypothetical protein
VFLPHMLQPDVACAVRSSATAEDVPTASLGIRAQAVKPPSTV